MSTVKLKFRPSRIEGKEGTIYYQITHNRVVRHITTKYKIYCSEWNVYGKRIAFPNRSSERYKILLEIKALIKLDLCRVRNIIHSLEQKESEYQVDDVLSIYKHVLEGETLRQFASSIINELRMEQKLRCVETYTTTLRSFMRFCNGNDVLITDIDPILISGYENYLKEEGLSMNSISFYMRVLRAIYNRAVNQDLVEQKNPFKRVYTGVDKTTKRALTLKAIKQIKDLDLSLYPKAQFARDMFMLSFYMRGISFVDMAYLTKKSLRHGMLTYYRRKTRQKLSIKWERCMNEIVMRYPQNSTRFLLPIITKEGVNERDFYKKEMSKINCQLKVISSILSLNIPLTMYVARHSWASIARSNKVPISVISEGMGHDSELTTQIYLASLDTAVVDRANKMILKLLV